MMETDQAEDLVTFSSAPVSPETALLTISSNKSSPRNKRKQEHPKRSIRPVPSVYERKAQGIVSLRFETQSSANSSDTGGEDLYRRSSPLSFADRYNQSYESQIASLANPDVQSNDHQEIEMQSQKYSFNGDLSVDVLMKESSTRNIGMLAKKGKIGTPMDVTRMQRVDDLDEEEFHLCSVLRITPLQYFLAKETLIQQFKIQGFFKKSAAQKMLRMDVNKTGKLYDYFMEKGWLLV